MVSKIEIKNFKSIQEQTVELNNLNILIGPNGSGKSNFISLFKFLERLSGQQLESYIFQSGGINNFLFKGFEESEFISLVLEFYKDYGYKCVIESNVVDYRLIENVYDKLSGKEWSLSNFEKESGLITHFDLPLAKKVYSYLKALKFFHFHDTSENARLKLPQSSEDVYELKGEAENLAPFLRHLREEHFDYYWKIVETVRLVYPVFLDFALTESPQAKGKIMLRWVEHNSGNVYTSKQISDGTLRFICLATLLNQPPATTYLPQTIILDEPELGLHPFAITILAEMIQKTALERQIIIATQSVSLINHFQPSDLLIVERDEAGASTLRRMKEEEVESWLEDYSLGQLWENNFFGGRP